MVLVLGVELNISVRYLTCTIDNNYVAMVVSMTQCQCYLKGIRKDRCTDAIVMFDNFFNTTCLSIHTGAMYNHVCMYGCMYVCMYAGAPNRGGGGWMGRNPP